ncbi:ABC transporter permease [Gordonia sp. X0973]|uniref:ABC transporter permease n=1 Tax=Gordonia sp. X0973 TaxID=2742602 RepID=UPI000F54905E|nr:ABC transporter permease [Gordonia sp. X0973]QKT07187.1 ABC transporter permease [Gordonia sp. X0973]
MSEFPVRKVVGLIVGAAIAIPLILLMFIGPASRGAPHDLPIGVVGPPAAADQVGQALAQRQPGAFEVRSYASQAELENAARHREVYGGFVLGPAPTTVIASGAGPAPAQLLTQIGTQIAARPGAPGTTAAAPRVVDVAPLAADDARGAGFGSMVMPVFMAGAILGVAIPQLTRRARATAALLPIGAAAVAATCVGAAMAVGVLPGGFWSQWLALGAGILAIASVTAGLVTLIGVGGMGIAAALFLLVGMPLAGIGAPPEFLPGIWGAVGQWLPLGATGTALRGAAYFADGDVVGAGTGRAFTALVIWIVVGYVLLGLAVARRRRVVAEVVEAETSETAVGA